MLKIALLCLLFLSLLFFLIDQRKGYPCVDPEEERRFDTCDDEWGHFAVSAVVPDE
ncbi:hypothetical protein [Novibacillus thermophilus]|uniref:hypothetical protein n=1 Tax=Novibacillus thermophilus TaxID=1471761 RepID=UPI001474EAE2|nr:hypothetical protein [Novibacillus thermophilus]